MTPQQVVALCLRLAALVWLLYAFGHTYGLVMYVDAAPGIGFEKTVALLFAFLQIAICVVLWFFPATIAGKLMPRAAVAAENPAPPTLVEWQTLGVICIGLWGMSRAVPDAIFWLTYFSFSVSSESDFGGLDSDQKANVVSTIAEIAISIWLLLGAKGFAAMLFKIRTAGVAK